VYFKIKYIQVLNSQELSILLPDKNTDLTLEYILLGLLREAPRHGYALFQTLSGDPALSRIWHVKRSKVYYLLDSLADRGLITFQVEHHAHQPDRKVFQVTDEGKEEFFSWMMTPVKSGRHVRIGFLSRLHFALQEGKDHALQLIDEQIGRCRSWQMNLEKQLKELTGIDFITKHTFRFRIGQVEAMLAWLSSCREDVQTGIEDIQ